MKLIGKTNDGYITEISPRELARFVGQHDEYDAGWRHNKEPAVGDEIEVSRIYDRLQAIEQAEENIRKAQERLRDTAKSLDFVAALIPSKSKNEE